MKKFIKIIFITLLFSNSIIFSSNLKNSPLSFSHSQGFYTEVFDLEITTDLPDTKIFYTLDGSNPLFGKSVNKLSSPVVIKIDPNITTNRDRAPAVVVRACIVNSDTLFGDVITQTYLFVNEVRNLSSDGKLPGTGWLSLNSGFAINYGLDPDIYNNASYSAQLEPGLLSIPTLSLVTDLGNLFDSDSGIYVNSLKHGKEWERPASLELLNPDGSEGFQINCGVRIRGGWSRNDNNPKHAFRFIFRSEYGDGKLNYPLFGDEGVDKFDNLDLRTSQNYSWSIYGDEQNTFLREVFSRDTQRDMNKPYTRSRFYHLYINGTYWGLYQTQERAEASFAKSYLGGKKDDYDVIKVDVGENFEKYVVEATDGTLDKWRELWNAGESGFANDELYYKVQGKNIDGSDNPNYEKLLDVENLIDYMLITFFVGDFDGPISAFKNNENPNNFYAIYNRVNPDGFKFFRHDAEHSLFNHPWGIDRTGPFVAGQNFETSNPQWIHQKLCENKNYKLKFADRVYKHLFNDGVLTLDKNRERINNRKKEIETAIVAESARWGDSHESRVDNPLTQNDWTREVNWILNTYLPDRKDILIAQLENEGLYFKTVPPQFNIKGGIVAKGTNIELSSSGGEIYYTTDGNDPLLLSEDSSGFSKVLIDADSPKRVLVPKSSQNELWRIDLTYNDDAWKLSNSLPGGIGYGDKYLSYITLSTETEMREGGNNPNTSCYIRVPFNTDNLNLEEANKLFLEIMYDDGFIAYLNGNQVLSVNVPTNPTWNSTSQNYLDSQGYEKFDISDYISELKQGDNLLAIHGLNISLQSSDFLILPKLTIEKTNINGSVAESAKLYDTPITIDHTIKIKTRTILNGNWSALNENTYLVDEDLSNLKITELHYHPIDEIIEQDTINDSEYEFIELKNIGSTELSLSGATFSNGISYQFPYNSIIEPNSFVVLASNSKEFNRRYGFDPFGEYKGQLKNGGERVTLLNAVGNTVFNFKYDDKSPWPTEADGEGYSLVSLNRNPTGDPDNVNYWTLSGNISGSPMEDDIVSDIKETDNNLYERFYLSQNYPNPFNPITNIFYSIPNYSFVKLKVYDILGNEVADLVNSFQKKGTYSIKFNAKDFASGIYFYRIQAGEYVDIRKMILLK